MTTDSDIAALWHMITRWHRKLKRMSFRPRTIWMAGIIGILFIVSAIGLYRIMATVDDTLKNQTLNTYEPKLTSIPVDENMRLMSPDGNVMIEIPLYGTPPKGLELNYRSLSIEEIPPLPNGYTPSNRIFDVSITDETISSSVSDRFAKPIKISIRLDNRIVALARGDPTRVILQHFDDDLGTWESLTTNTNFKTFTAVSAVFNLSYFALTIRDPEYIESDSTTNTGQSQKTANVEDASITPTIQPGNTTIPISQNNVSVATPTPTKNPVYTPSPTPTPTIIPLNSPTPNHPLHNLKPTSTLTPSPTAVQTITPVPTVTPTFRFPNLIPFKPDGWSSPLLLSAEPSAYIDIAAPIVKPLIAGQGTYIHWAIKNDSNISFDEDFQIGIVVDGVLVLNYTVHGLIAGEDLRNLNSMITINNPVEHKITLTIDYAFQVAETDEFDNINSVSYFWEIPPTPIPAVGPSATPGSVTITTPIPPTNTPTPIPPTNTPTPIPPTNTPTPIPPTNTPTPIPPTNTPTPIPLVGDDRFGVVMLHADSLLEQQYYLEQLGVKWYLDFTADPNKVTNSEKVLFLWTTSNENVWSTGLAESIDSLSEEQIEALGFPHPAAIRKSAGDAPGSYWYMFGEPNRQPSLTGSVYAPVFHYYMNQIKSADPSAKIIGPSMLNWDFTCYGCSGYQLGSIWLNEFITAYKIKYGQKPPVDAWSIDLYPIDWTNVPNNDPDPSKQPNYKGNKVLHSYIVTEQLEAMRSYLNGHEYANTPIWVTEVAIHLGYEGWAWDPYPSIKPIGEYNWENMSNYLTQILNWFEINAASNKVDKWFFFTPWKDIVNVGPDGYMGTIFFNGKGPNSQMNCLGELYKSWSLQYPTKKQCDESGNTVPE